MVRPDIKSVSDLAGKTIAIDDRYSASNGSVRTAIVAAGAPEAQLSEGQTTAINRLVDGEVPAAVLALVSPEAAERYPCDRRLQDLSHPALAAFLERVTLARD